MPSHTAPAAARSARRCATGAPSPPRRGTRGLPPRCAARQDQTAHRTSAAPAPAAAPPYWEKHGRTSSVRCLPPLRSLRSWFWCSPFPGTTPPAARNTFCCVTRPFNSFPLGKMISPSTSYSRLHFYNNMPKFMVQAKAHCDCVFGVMCKPYQRYIVKIPRKIAFKGRNDTILVSCFCPESRIRYSGTSKAPMVF